MFQGTGSDVGKSLIVAGLARAFTPRGLRGAAVQAAEHVEQRRGRPPTAARSAAPRRCRRAPRGVPPSVHMNPVLLKPQSEIGAQVVVQGKVHRQRQGARLPGHEAEAAAARARQLRAAERGGRSRAGRGRRQRGRGQSAAARHRQHGLRARRRRAGGAASATSTAAA